MIKKCGDGSVKIELPKDKLFIKRCIRYINKRKSNRLWIDVDKKKNPMSLEFLNGVIHKELVESIDLCGNFSVTNAVYDFTEIEELSYYPTNKESIDLQYFHRLRCLTTASPTALVNLDKVSILSFSQHDNNVFKPEVVNRMKGLKDLRLHGPKDFSFKNLNGLNDLRIVFITECNIKDLSGIEKFNKLHLLCISFCRSFKDITGISKLPVIKKVMLESCPKLTDISELGKIKNLNTLILQNIKNCDLSFLEDMECKSTLECLVLRNCGKIPTIKFLNNYPKLESFDFMFTNVEDGDLTPLLRLNSASTFNRRHYNLKEDQLPFQHGFMYWWLKEDDQEE